MAPGVAQLQIWQLESEESFYLYYLNSADEFLTDTWHQDIQSAIHQAEFEFGVGADDWEWMGGRPAGI